MRRLLDRSIVTRWVAALGIAVAAAGCEVPGAPQWTLDLMFPLRYPDVALTSIAIGGQIPPVDLPFTTAIAGQGVSGSIGEILSEDLAALRAEVIFSTTANVTGQMEISVAADTTNLFATDPALAMTIMIPLQPTPGDTTAVTADLALFQNTSRLFFRTRGTLRGAAGGTTVGPTDVLSVGVNLFATIAVAQ